MKYAIGVYLDPESSTQHKRLRQNLIEQNIIHEDFLKYTSHLTFCIFEKLDIDKAITALKNYTEKTKFPILEANSLHIFKTSKKVACIAINRTDQLYKIQKNIFEILTPFSDKTDKHYKPENWIPHITISIDTDISRIKDLTTIYEQSSPLLPMRPIKLAIVEFYPPKDLATIPIQI